MSKSAKKKSKVPKLTEAEYAAYVSGLREAGEERVPIEQEKNNPKQNAE